MKTGEIVSRVPGLCEIDERNRSFDLGFGRDYDLLRRSIETVGILQPLIVRENRSESNDSSTQYNVHIVCGFSRFLAAAQGKLEELPARVLSHDTSDADCLRLAFFDNLAHRDFNLIERAIILSRLEPHVGRDRLIRDYLPLLGMKPAAAVFDRTVRLMQLIDPLKRKVAEERIEARTAADIAGWKTADQLPFADLIEGCRPSVSVVREWAETLSDLARREDCSVAKILADDAIRSALEPEDRSPAECTAEIRRILQEKRLPNLSATALHFEAARNELRLPPSMRLEPSTNFESDEMRLEIRFHHTALLREAVERMREWFDDPDLLERLWPWR